jgi:catechol 2,3-dioxygenase-like lactoylglutathione lyase family enzyme
MSSGRQPASPGARGMVHLTAVTTYTSPRSDQARMVTTEQTSFVRAIPALAVSNVPRAVAFFADVLGFDSVLVQADYGIARRDAVEVHFWAAAGPEGSGAEPRLAGTTSCRLQVNGIATLYQQCQTRQVVHPNGGLRTQPWGTREVTILDPDRNAVTLLEGT